MNCRHRSMFWICKEHGQAVGCSHRHEDAGLISQQRIAFGLSTAGLTSRRAPGKAVLKVAVPGVTNLINDRGMDLPQRRKCEVFRAKLLKEKVPVLPHSELRLTLRESQIEAGRVSAAHPATASAKGMDQPGIAGEERVFNPCKPSPRDEM
jgi:hypothetical protein